MLGIRKRGKVYQLEGRVAGKRVRLSLDTGSEDSAKLLKNKIDLAITEGKDSKTWQEVKLLLPAATFQRLCSLVGVTPRSQHFPTWDMLLAAFNADQERRVLSGDLKTSSKRRYDGSLREFSAFLREKNISELSEIKAPLIAEWKAWRLKRILARKKGHSKAVSMIHDTAAVHQVFNFGLRLDCDWVIKNPVRSEKVRTGEPNPYTEQELERLAGATNPHEVFIHKFLLGTGLRPGDACALRWGQVNLKDRCIAVDTAKRGTLAWVPLGPETHFMLETEKLSRAARDDQHVLLDRRGKPFTTKSLLRLVQRLAKRAEVERPKTHRYRHTFISRMVASGANYADVGRMVGDTSATVEKHYAKFSPEWQQRLRRFVEDRDDMVGTHQPHRPQPEKRIH
jgi:integrase